MVIHMSTGTWHSWVFLLHSSLVVDELHTLHFSDSTVGAEDHKQRDKIMEKRNNEPKTWFIGYYLSCFSSCHETVINYLSKFCSFHLSNSSPDIPLNKDTQALDRLLPPIITIYLALFKCCWDCLLRGGRLHIYTVCYELQRYIETFNNRSPAPKGGFVKTCQACSFHYKSKCLSSHFRFIALLFLY